MGENNNNNNYDAVGEVLVGLLLLGLSFFLDFITINNIDSWGLFSDGKDIHISIYEMLSKDVYVTVFGEGMKSAAGGLIAGLALTCFGFCIYSKESSIRMLKGILMVAGSIVSGIMLYKFFGSKELWNIRGYADVSSVLEPKVYWGMIPIGLALLGGIGGLTEFFSALSGIGSTNTAVNNNTANNNQNNVKTPSNSANSSSKQYAAPTSSVTNAKPVTPDALASQPVAKQEHMAAIQSMAAQHNGMMLAVHDKPIVVGRNPAECNMVYQDGTPGVSGKHCTIEYRPQTNVFVVTDLNSSYGSFLMNGVKMEPNRHYSFNPGDSFYVGNPQNIIKLMTM